MKLQCVPKIYCISDNLKIHFDNILRYISSIMPIFIVSCRPTAWHPIPLVGLQPWSVGCGHLQAFVNDSYMFHLFWVYLLILMRLSFAFLYCSIKDELKYPVQYFTVYTRLHKNLIILVLLIKFFF